MKKVKDNIYYVGVLDKDLRVFDIIMHTDYGTSYNSYIVKGKDKTVLFETSKEKFFDEYLENIKEVCDPSEIDYIVVNHTEPDHTGVMFKLLDYAKNATILGSQSAINFLKEIVNNPFPYQVVTEKDKIDIGGMTLNFLSVPMLHWPDSMYTYIPEAKALFTCDSFGCHYADDRIFNDLIDGDFTDAYKYYFDNIMGPYKNPHMVNALKKVENLDIDFIGNGHGPVLRTDVKKYIDMYVEWCKPTVNEVKTVVIAYVSSYGYTEMLSNSIEKGLIDSGIKVLKYNLVTDDKAQAAAAIETADGFLLGSPTMVGDALPPVKEMLLHLNPVIHRGKPASAFGSYGWSGEAVPTLMSMMTLLRLNLPLEGFRVRFKPTDEDLKAAYEYGKDFASKL